MPEPGDASHHDPTRLSRQPVDPAVVATRLRRPLRWRVEQVSVTGSTNADLAAAAADRESGQVRTAEEQRSGRGRSGRDWVCPPGAGLMFSVLLRLPQVPADRRGWTGALLGLAIVRALEDALGDHHGPAGSGRSVRVGLKWPNDVLVDGAKCAGILGEAVGDAVVVGAGINVSLTGDELPRTDATSLLLAGGAGSSPPVLPPWLDRPLLLASILDFFGDLLDRWVGADGDVDGSGLRAEYRRSCATLGEKVRLILPGGTEVRVTAVDVAADGALVVQDQTGRQAAYSAADVVHLRGTE